ncbi:MAG: DNA/RNA nuclease SfsA [Rhodospirillaceae bacterium]|nr:DNA/RNA nuclease SfsA [Rhodospirillaceae bacterium]
MIFETPLIEGVLISRYKRFFADVRLSSGEVVTAHCANSGSMLSVKDVGARVWLSPAANPARTLRYTWEIVEIFGGLVGINTAHPNRIVAEAIAAGLIQELSGYGSLKREQKYGKNSRIDILLTEPDRPTRKSPCYVEVKNVTMKRKAGADQPAEFPDSVTERGAKHLMEMADMVKAGARSVMVYLVQRADCGRFAVAADIDPAYAQGLKRAMAVGVEAVCYGCEVTPDAITIAKALTIEPLTLALPD